MCDRRAPLAEPDRPYRAVGALLDEYRQRAPHKPAIVDVERDAVITFAQLADAVDAVGTQLLQRGVGKGARILLASAEGLDKIVLWLGIWRVGAIVCPLDAAFVGAAAAARLLDTLAPSLILLPAHADAGALAHARAPLVRCATWQGGGASGADRTDHDDGVAADGAHAATDRYAQAAAQHDDGALLRFSVTDTRGLPALPDTGFESSDVAAMCSTSGTTGQPKIVVYDHACYWLNGLDTIDMLDIRADDRALEYRTFDWYSAQILSLMPFLQTGSTLCVARRFSRSRFADWIAQHRVTVCAGVPAVLNLLLEAPVDVSDGQLASLRLMTCSTAPLSPVQWKRFEQRYGVRVLNLYGSSEAGWMCGSRVQRRKIGTVGYPAPRVGFDVVDSHGDSCGTDDEGQVVVSGPKLALGLLQADQSLDPIRGRALAMRDMAARDAQGFVRVAGRIDDLIIRGGVKIVPQEIEDVVLTHPAARDAAALGVPDPIYGQEPVCFVVAQVGTVLSAQEVLLHCRAHLPREKLPKQVYLVDALPRNARGKVLRDALRREWWLATHAQGL
ncbi:MAG TPA: class I adenylate-forming enzyme family protein [Paraburkholderia sp.]|jgi:acyl-coenzyme A synthetase/AMP-(fatty) acid ligase|nr:class I adenylate-forming enzyme family protein [Paraburkholderia sp.]